MKTPVGRSAKLGLVLGAALVVPPAASAAITQRGAIRSFDGTPIVYNLFVPDDASGSRPVPIVFQGHGWGGSGQRTVGGLLQRLLESGYAVITWDSRGFGDSGGEAEVDSPEYEAKDTSALIDFVGQRAEILCDAPGGPTSCASTNTRDPRMGFEGGSYAGGIQLVTAATDRRVDAIVPDITWNDLRYSLFPGNVIKLEWDEALYAAGLATAASGGIDPASPSGIQTGNYPLELHLIEAKGTVLGYPDHDSLRWFEARSLVGYGEAHPLRVPALFTQGLCDTLFNANEAYANYRAVRAQHRPAKLLLKSSGHSSCPWSQGTRVADETVAWLDRYVKASPADPGSGVEVLLNDGNYYAYDDYPRYPYDATDLEPGELRVVRVAGGPATVVNTGAKTSLVGETPATFTAVPSGPADPGTLTVDTGIVGDGSLQVLGIPHAWITYSGTGPGTHLFFKLVDREANQVIDLQEAAIRLDGLGAGPQSAELDLVGTGYIVPAGHHVDLQLATSSNAMSEYRGPSVVNLARVIVDVPTVPVYVKP